MFMFLDSKLEAQRF